MNILAPTKTGPTDQQLLMLASSIAKTWVCGAHEVLRECGPDDKDQIATTLAMLTEFGHLERYVRANLIPNVNFERQELFIQSLEKHWKCEARNPVHQVPPTVADETLNCLH